MQVNTAFIWKIKIQDHVDGLNIDTSGYQIGADQCFELTFSESVEDFYPFVGFHVGMQILILVFFFVEFL